MVLKIIISLFSLFLQFGLKSSFCSDLQRHLGVFIEQRNVEHQPPQQMLHHGRPQLTAHDEHHARYWFIYTEDIYMFR